MSFNQENMKKSNTDINLITRFLLRENTTKEKEMIDKLIHDDEKSRRDFDAYIEVWEKSADIKDFDKIDTLADWQKVRSRIGFKTISRRLPFRSYLVRIAAVLILAAGLTYLLSRVIRNTSTDKMYYYESIASNELKTVELPDGSTIFMNKNSRIVRNNGYGINNRDIILEGEAFFEVARNEDVPFRVHTLNSVVEVLGTSFNIKTDSLQVIVGVLTGKVAFYESKNSENRVDILPQNTGFFDATSNIIHVENTFDMNSIAWHSKEFVFKYTPLQNVCDVLAEYYNLDLVKAPDVQFVDSINLTLSTSKPLNSIINTINSFLTEDVELITIDNKLIVRKQ